MNFVISNELDYSLISLNERKDKVNELLRKYDDELLDYRENYQKVNLNQSGRTSEFDSVSRDLEKVADYLLYMDNKEQREKNRQEKILNNRMKENRKKKEHLTDNFTFVDEKKREYVKNIKIYGLIKVTEEDRNQYKELADTGNLIKSLKKQIHAKVDLRGNALTDAEIKRMRWYLIDIAKEEIAIKEQLKKYISFKNISPSHPFYDLECFSFCNRVHIRSLIDNYQQLKNNCLDKTDDDFKLLLSVFDDLVEKTIKEPILKKILDLKIDGEIQNNIKNEVFALFNIDISQQRVSQIIDEVIPNLIIKQYKQDFEDWIFTYMKKGHYKTCSICKNNFLATTKYFHRDSYFKDGLKKCCKNCRKKK